MIYMFFPILMWIFIVLMVVAAKSSIRHSKNQQTNIPQTPQNSRVQPLQNRNNTYSRNPSPGATKKKYGLNNRSFHNNDFDSYEMYEAKGRKQDYVSGYDKKFNHNGRNYKHNAEMQYSHNYNGHEPWDDCLPKEKDPWDKDFYPEN